MSSSAISRQATLSTLLRLGGLTTLVLLMGASPATAGSDGATIGVQLLADQPPATDDIERAARRLFITEAVNSGAHREVLRHFEVRSVTDLPSGGTRVSLDARIDGVLVLDSAVEVLVSAEGVPVAVSISPAVRRMRGRPLETGAVSANDAARRAVGALGRVAAAFEDRGSQADGWQHLRATDPTILPARGRPAMHVADDGTLVPVWEVEAGLAGPRGPVARFRIDRLSGQVLQQVDLTHDATYRVWIDDDLRPQDSPNVDVSPHPTGAPDTLERDLVEPTDVEVDGLNVNPDGGTDAWLPSGAETLEGNNVHVYGDGTTYGDEAGSKLPISGSAPGVFDSTYDFELDAVASESQLAATAAQAFYTTNWLHDRYYDVGFDEAAGNAQLDNYGRGGVDGDPINIRLWADWSDLERNNANMTTPADGSSPQMNVYIFNPLSEIWLDGQATPLVAGSAEFGPSDVSISGELVWWPDEGATACEPTEGDVVGRVVLVNRGPCKYAAKALNAQNAGAIGVVLIDSESSELPPLLGFDDVSTGVVIPMVSVTAADGEALADEADLGPVSLTLTRPPDVDGGLDSGMVAHEWGHYLFYRHISCAATQCGAMSEGWSDATALHMMVREGDDLDGVYPYSAFLSADPEWAYYGGRRMPYSRDPAINGLSFRHIMDGESLPDVPSRENSHGNEEVHNAGEIWASALFDAYLALLDQPGADFDDVDQRWPELVVTALGFIPDSPSYLEGRDGLLAAALVVDPDSAQLMAQAFADRGMGTCAEGPEGESNSLDGVIEDFQLHPDLVFGTPTLDDSLDSCDGDGQLDVGERGLLTIPIHNNGFASLAAGSLTVVSDDGTLLFPEGDTATVPPVDGRTSGQVSVVVELADSVDGVTAPALSISLADPDLCEEQVDGSATVLANVDLSGAGSSLDTFQSPVSVWTPDEDDAPATWALQSTDWGDMSWTGLGNDFVSDTRLISPPLTVASGLDLVLLFTHTHDLQTFSTNGRDGAVIELRVDGGDWQDAATWADPNYSGTISSEDNPLDGSEAYVGLNPSWPEPDEVQINLGQTLGGHQVELSFRLVTDSTRASTGWSIGEVEVSGLVEGPFPGVTTDPAACANDGPSAVDPDTGRCGCSSSPKSAPLTALLAAGLTLLCCRRRRTPVCETSKPQVN
jgi:large repetitive protein